MFWDVLKVGVHPRSSSSGGGRVISTAHFHPFPVPQPPGEGGMPDSIHLTEGQVTGMCTSGSPNSIRELQLKFSEVGDPAAPAGHGLRTPCQEFRSIF